MNFLAWTGAIVASTILVLALAAAGSFLGMLAMGEPMAAVWAQLTYKGAIGGAAAGAAFAIVLLTRYWGRAP